MLVSTAGDVIVHRADSSLTIEFDAFPKYASIFSVANFVVSVAVVHESVTSLASRHVFTPFCWCRRHLLLLTFQ